MTIRLTKNNKKQNRELKKSTHDMVERFCQEKETHKINKTEIVEMKNTICQIKNTMEQLGNRLGEKKTA